MHMIMSKKFEEDEKKIMIKEYLSMNNSFFFMFVLSCNVSVVKDCIMYFDFYHIYIVNTSTSFMSCEMPLRDHSLLLKAFLRLSLITNFVGRIKWSWPILIPKNFAFFFIYDRYAISDYSLMYEDNKKRKNIQIL